MHQDWNLHPRSKLERQPRQGLEFPQDLSIVGAPSATGCRNLLHLAVEDRHRQARPRAEWTWWLSAASVALASRGPGLGLVAHLGACLLVLDDLFLAGRVLLEPASTALELRVGTSPRFPKKRRLRIRAPSASESDSDSSSSSESDSSSEESLFFRLPGGGFQKECREMRVALSTKSVKVTLF